MSKQEIIDYVMNTPYNTNPTILNQKLSEMEVQADWNQNDPTKADYIKNKPEIGGGGSGGEFKTLKIVASDFDVTTGKIAFKCNNTLDEVFEWIVAGKLVHVVIDCTPLGEPFPYTSTNVTMPLNSRDVEVAIVYSTHIENYSFGDNLVYCYSYKYGAAQMEQFDFGTIEWGAT